MVLLSGPSMAQSYETGHAAYSRHDYAAAFQIWKSLAGQGSPPARFGLGELYSRGLGVPRDDQEAARWYRLAASGGYVPAQSRLASIYDEGRGVPQNLAIAMKWYRKAALQGDLSARISLGLIYFNGRGVPRNHQQAARWFQLAAEQGDALAQYNLGLIYSNGLDAALKDDVQAMIWFIIAEKAGNAEARKSHETLAAGLSQEQLRKAEKSAQDWMTSKAQDRAAKCSMFGGSGCK
jgi:hypothetical protein